MSFVSHDLICEDGHEMPQEVYRRSEGPPPCPKCGKPTRIAWFSGAAPGFTGFGTMNVDGKEMSTGDFEAYKRKMEADNPGMRVKVDNPSDAETDRRIEERRQRVINSRKERGIDVQAVGEQRVEQAQKKLEAAQRGNVAPTKIAEARQQVHAIANSFKQPA